MRVAQFGGRSYQAAALVVEDPRHFTGASSGIGAQFARQLAAEGFNVALAARRKALLDSLGDDLRRRFGVETRSLVADSSQDEAVARLSDAVADLDIGLVISNAGTGNPGRFLDEDPGEQLDRFRLNALSHLNMAYLFGRRLARRGRGGLVLGGAMGAIDGIPFMATDAAAKALVQSLGESLHVEFARHGIRVMTLVVPPHGHCDHCEVWPSGYLLSQDLITHIGNLPDPRRLRALAMLGPGTSHAARADDPGGMREGVLDPGDVEDLGDRSQRGARVLGDPRGSSVF